MATGVFRARRGRSQRAAFGMGGSVRDGPLSPTVSHARRVTGLRVAFGRSRARSVGLP